MEEIWKPIEGDEQYWISNYGRVLSFKEVKRFPNGKIKSPFVNRGRYLVVTLSDNKKHKVHRLVAQAFIPNPHNLPQINHIDGNGFNNHVSNLEWCTQKFNNNHRFVLGTMSNKGEKNPQSQLTNQQALEIYNLVHNNTDGLTHRQIGEMYGVKPHVVTSIKSGKRYNSVTRHKPIPLFREIKCVNQEEY